MSDPKVLLLAARFTGLGVHEGLVFQNSNLLAVQQMRHKRLEDAREGRYEPMCKDANVVEAKRQSEMEKRELMLQLVNEITSTYPNLADNVKKIETLLRA